MSDGQESKKPKKMVPNYFVAVQITNKQVNELYFESYVNYLCFFVTQAVRPILVNVTSHFKNQEFAAEIRCRVYDIIEKKCDFSISYDVLLYQFVTTHNNPEF